MKQFRDTGYFVLEDGTVIGKRASVVKPKITKTGYAEVNLTASDRRLYLRVHRIVAEIYIPNPDNKPFVNHKDGNKLNNSVSNLEWVTHQENMEHAKNHKLIHMGDRNSKSKVSEKDVEEICKLMQYGLRNCDIRKEFPNISHAVISSIRIGVCWTHISCKYTIPKKSRSLSEETAHWICDKLEKKFTTTEILKLTDNKNITKDIIKDMRRKRIYSDICKLYNF